MINVKICKLHADAQIPQYATDGSAGFDLVAIEDVVIAPGETALVRTGLAFEIPPGYEMQIRPRSGISLRTKLRVANSPGTIDSDFRAEVAVIVDNIAAIPSGETDYIATKLDGSTTTVRGYVAVGSYIIRKGDRIAQGVIAPVARASFEVADELSETERGSGGFGHSGVKAEVGVE